MRIGINLLALLPGISGGIEFYIRNLLRALFERDRHNTYYLFTNRDNDASFVYNAPNVTRVLLPVCARPQWKRIAYEQLRLPWLSRSLKLDVLHSPTYTWPVLAPVAGVVTICDMLYRHYPESIERAKLAFWRIFIPWSVQRCKRVITISDHARKDIVADLRVPARKVVVTPLALDASLVTVQLSRERVDELLAKHSIQRPYLLYVGGVGKHKNPDVLVRALAELRKRPTTSNLSAVITGNDYGVRHGIDRLALELGLQDYVQLPGYIARADLPAVYQGASVYVASSLFEGFGLTALEAMAYGIPVVVSDRASLPEVVGDAGVLADAEDPTRIAEAVARVLEEPQFRRQLIRNGYKRVRAYSWQETARLTLSAYDQALQG